MSDRKVAQWSQRGRVYCWRYIPQTYVGWQFTPDEIARDSLLQLLDLMLAAKYSSSQLIRLSRPPNEIAAIPSRPHVRWSAGVSELKLSYPKGSVDPDQWCLERDGRRLVVELGEETLLQFREGVAEVKDAQDDWAIGPDDDDGQVVYFRALPGPRRRRGS